MRYILYPLAIVIVLICSLNSCAPSIISPLPPNGLVASPDSLHLTGIPDTLSTSASLLCGCSFKLAVVPASGDTNRIHMLPLEKLDSLFSSHHLDFFGVAGTPSGKYAANFSLSTYDYNTQANFYDTVHVFLSVP